MSSDPTGILDTSPVSSLGVLADDAMLPAARQAVLQHSARAYDAMIAAIAIANDLPVYTLNPKDFRSIDGLSVVVVA